MSASEAGYRTAVSRRLSIDLAAYYNDYKDLQTVEPDVPFVTAAPPPLHLIIPLAHRNLMHGEAHGLEIFGDWKVANHWTLSPGYSFEDIHMHTEPASQDSTSAALAEGTSPHHSAQLRSRLDLPYGLQWDASAYFVDRLPSGNIPSYTRVDTQLTWKWGERATLSIAGQNLQSDHHAEFQDFFNSILTTQAKRSAYARISWGF